MRLTEEQWVALTAWVRAEAKAIAMVEAITARTMLEARRIAEEADQAAKAARLALTQEETTNG